MLVVWTGFPKAEAFADRNHSWTLSKRFMTFESSDCFCLLSSISPFSENKITKWLQMATHHRKAISVDQQSVTSLEEFNANTSTGTRKSHIASSRSFSGAVFPTNICSVLHNADHTTSSQILKICLFLSDWLLWTEALIVLLQLQLHANAHKR